MNESFAIALGQYMESGVALDQAIPAAVSASGMDRQPTIAEVRRALASLESAKDKATHGKIEYARLYS